MITQKEDKMNNTRDDWDEGKLELCNPEYFKVQITYNTSLYWELTEEEVDRLEGKLKMVEEMAQKLAANMLKGTLKYPHDDWSVEEWIDFLVDDASDTLNYAYKLKEAYMEEKSRWGW